MLSKKDSASSAIKLNRTASISNTATILNRLGLSASSVNQLNNHHHQLDNTAFQIANKTPNAINNNDNELIIAQDNKTGTAIQNNKNNNENSPITTKITSSSASNNKRQSSFLNKHLMIQRRKTIHDIINLDILNNLISSASSHNNNNNNDRSTKTNSALVNNNKIINIKEEDEMLDNSNILNKNIEETQSISSNSYRHSPRITNNSTKKSDSTSFLINQNNNNNNLHITRQLIKQGHVQLLNVCLILLFYFDIISKFYLNIFNYIKQYGKQDRYILLFNDLLIIAKQK